jgi:hypothetical protein
MHAIDAINLATSLSVPVAGWLRESSAQFMNGHLVPGIMRGFPIWQKKT